MTPSTVAVVGASVAGARTIQALRVEGFQGRIVLIGAESELPYDKPSLSKRFLVDQVSVAVPLFRDGLVSLAVELRLGVPARHLDTQRRLIELEDGVTVDFDTCVVATGITARRLPWGEHEGLHVLRSLDDARRIREALHAQGTVVVVGGGFIGGEVAASASALGCDVTVIDPLIAPLAHIVGAELGASLVELHARHGVRARFGNRVTGIEPRADRKLIVALDDGSNIAADTVVVGIGGQPNVDWLAGSGLYVDDGLVCDEFCRAVDVPNVFAAGDVARWMNTRHGGLARAEHWTNAVEQAACVAHNIAHPKDLRAYAPLEYFWSDLYDWKVQMLGRPNEVAETIVVGDLAAPKPHLAVCLVDAVNTIVGVATVNWPRALNAVRPAVGERAAADQTIAALRSLAAERG